MTEITDDIEAVVEGTELPRRLKDEVYETIRDRDDVSVEHADEIAQAVEAQHLETRVDPLDPVGTVSAQSIGEPGTQMSVPADERVLVRRDGETDVAEIGPLVDSYMADRETRSFDGHEVALVPDGLEALSLTHDEQSRWKPVEEVSRHESPDELVRFELESGRTVRATKAHSFVTRRDDELVPVPADALGVGDRLPVVGDFDPDERTVDLGRLDRSVATDGGVPAHCDRTTDRRPGAATVKWNGIESIETVSTDQTYVYDFSVEGLETFTTAEGVVTHNTMNTFHYAGVAEIDVTQGLPRLIELVDARKEPDTPMMTVHLEGEYAQEREKAHQVVWNIEATRILALGDVSTNVADMQVRIDLKEGTLRDRWPKLTVEEGGQSREETDREQLDRAIEGPREDLEYVGDPGHGILQTIASELSEINGPFREDLAIVFEPEEPSYRGLLQLVEELRDIVFKGIEDISRVVIKKEQTDDGEEFVLYTEGSAFGEALEIDGVDATRTTCNNIHEINRQLGVEAAREAIIDETMNTLEEQGLDDVNERHLMLVADIMTNRGTIESIGRHGISGSKESVLARAAFEVTVNHLLDAAVHGEVDDLNGVTENVIVGKPIQLGTGDVDLRMGARRSGPGGSADD